MQSAHACAVQTHFLRFRLIANKLRDAYQKPSKFHWQIIKNQSKMEPKCHKKSGSAKRVSPGATFAAFIRIWAREWGPVGPQGPPERVPKTIKNRSGTTSAAHGVPGPRFDAKMSPKRTQFWCFLVTILDSGPTRQHIKNGGNAPLSSLKTRRKSQAKYNNDKKGYSKV